MSDQDESYSILSELNLDSSDDEHEFYESGSEDEMSETSCLSNDASSMSGGLEMTQATRQCAQDARDRGLIQKMLELDTAPVLTTKLIDFFKQDTGCNILTEYITRVEETTSSTATTATATDAQRPRDMYGDSEGLIMSYRATMFLATDDLTDDWLMLLESQCERLVPALWKVFQPNSIGSLVHGCRVLNLLLKHCTEPFLKVLEVMSVETSINLLLPHLIHPCVTELVLNLVCKPPTITAVCFYKTSPEIKWSFYKHLADYRLLSQLTLRVVMPHSTDAYARTASELLMEALDRISADSNGSLLLQPLVYCPDLLNSLLTVALQEPSIFPMGQREAALNVVHHLLTTCVKSTVTGPPTSPYESYGGMGQLQAENQLYPLRAKLFSVLKEFLPMLSTYLITSYQRQQNITLMTSSSSSSSSTSSPPSSSSTREDESESEASHHHPPSNEVKVETKTDMTDDPSIASIRVDTTTLYHEAIRHTSYVVKVPFGTFRLTMVTILVACVTFDPASTLPVLPANLWRALLHWFFEYCHTNLYHALWNALLFQTLRHNSDSVMKCLMQKCKLVTVLMESFHSHVSLRSRRMDGNNAGYIVQALNLIRLSAAALPPSSYLASFLANHSTWRSFVNTLCTYTRSDYGVLGLGFQVPDNYREGNVSSSPSLPSSSPPETLQGIELGSHYAHSLGFIDDVAWPDTQEEEGEEGKNGTLRGTTSSSKKKKKKKRILSFSSSSSTSSDSIIEEGGDAAGGVAPPSTMSRSEENGNGSVATPGKKKKKKKKKVRTNNTTTSSMMSTSESSCSEEEETVSP